MRSLCKGLHLYIRVVDSIIKAVRDLKSERSNSKNSKVNMIYEL